jgi:sec-independent protein translocase protein TatB
VFNLSGSEIVIILLLALLVVGPERLPEFIRKAGNVYGELRRMSQGFQSELREALDEPMREIRETTNLAKSAFTLPTDDAPASGRPAAPAAAAAPSLPTAPAAVDPVVAAEQAASQNEALGEQTPASDGASGDAAGGGSAPSSPFDRAVTTTALPEAPAAVPTTAGDAQTGNGHEPVSEPAPEPGGDSSRA